MAFKQTNCIPWFTSSRYKKLEEIRLEKEHQFQIEQARLENERRKEEREHELKIFSMMISSINQSCQNSTTPTSTFSQPFANVEQQTNIGNSYGCDAQSLTRYNLDGDKTYVDL